MSTKNAPVELEKVVVKFAGDSGDGMQLTGTQFTDTSALLGNDLATFPDFPAEIRAPQGTVAGVSGFQVHIGQIEINTPGDITDVLVAMNPAALKANKTWISDLQRLLDHPCQAVLEMQIRLATGGQLYEEGVGADRRC